MFAFFAALLAVSAIVNLPAWFLARRRSEATWWLPLIGTPAILTWVALVALGVGPQSLSNVVEAMALTAFSVLLCYAQVLVLNRRFTQPRRTSAFLLASLVGVAVLLRLFMPPLPE
jgi:predicted branched-subunit amino acid permease